MTIWIKNRVVILLNKKQACKPGSVIPQKARVPIIYLDRGSLHNSSGLPLTIPGITGTKAGSPVSPCGEIVMYMALQPMRHTATDVTTNTGGLLPHLFTLTLPWAGRLFSVILLYPRGYLPIRKHGALCCPDFPPPATAGSDRAACFVAKVVRIFERLKVSKNNAKIFLKGKEIIMVNILKLKCQM